MDLILGSQSPRRLEILNHFNFNLTQISPSFDEGSVSYNGNLEQYVCAISDGKSDSLVEQFPDRLILTADSIVYCNGTIYGKPKDLNQAIEFLSELVGNWHSVWSGVTLRINDQLYHAAEETKVLFNQLTLNQIQHYLTKFNWKDKAGSYGIQVCCGLIVNRIEGCFYNVKGLPINTVATLMRKFNIELWEYL